MESRIDSETDGTLRAKGTGVAVLAYVVSLLAAIAIIASYHPTGILLALVIAVPVAALAWMILRMRALRRVTGPLSPATQAYNRRFIPLMIGYALLLILAVWANKAVQPTGALAFALAILPSLPLIGVIWAMGRLIIEEQDEYLRMLHVRQSLIATGVMLAVTCIWGFLEQFNQVPHLPLYWAFILWCGGLGVGSCVNEFRR